MHRAFSSLVAIFIFFGALILLILLFNIFSHRGYGGNPSKFAIEGTVLYVADYGNVKAWEGLIIPFLNPYKTKAAVWIIDLESGKLEKIKEINDDRNDALWRKAYDNSVNIVALSGFSYRKLIIAGKTYMIKTQPTGTDAPGVIEVTEKKET